MKICKLIAAALTIVLPLICSSCDDAQSEFSTYRCFLVIENQYHQNAVLASAMNPNAPGIFCTITVVNKNGVNYYHVENSDGHTDDIPFNAFDERRSRIVGMNNGLIIGYGNMSIPPTFYAFDRECPNCFNPDAIPVRSRPLKVSSSGIASCSVCKSEYNLNSGGYGKGKRTRYHASTTGPLGTLTVN